jgi:nitrite reductase (NADH) large subunit
MSTTHTTNKQTIEDLENMLAYVKENNVKSAAVIGGGLLGLEAAKAVADMSVKSHIIEFAPILMCRQVMLSGIFCHMFGNVSFAHRIPC